MNNLPRELQNKIMLYARPIHPCSKLIKNHKYSINNELNYIVTYLEEMCSYDKDTESLVEIIKEGLNDFEEGYYWLSSFERTYSRNTKIFKPYY
jgi:hypothetical protein